MSIEAVTYYQAVCDACLSSITEEAGHDFSAWSDEGQAHDEVTHGEGHVTPGGIVLCRECFSTLLGEHSEDDLLIDRLQDDVPEDVAAAEEWAARRGDAARQQRTGR